MQRRAFVATGAGVAFASAQTSTSPTPKIMRIGTRRRLHIVVYAKATQDRAIAIAGKIPNDVYWERITYFLEHVAPVGGEYKSKWYGGLNFCQGTVSEMLEDPKTEIFDVIRYFGSRRKYSTYISGIFRAVSAMFGKRIRTTATSTCCGPSGI